MDLSRDAFILLQWLEPNNRGSILERGRHYIFETDAWAYTISFSKKHLIFPGVKGPEREANHLYTMYMLNMYFWSHAKVFVTQGLKNDLYDPNLNVCVLLIQGTASEATLVALLGAKAKMVRRVMKENPELSESTIISKLVGYASSK